MGFSCCFLGDASSTVSAICYTIPKSAKGSSLYMLESGSDFKSRGLADENRLVLGPGVTVVTCDVTLIDDSEYEEEEEFEVVLADASDNARIGSRASANVVIAGPNDASTVFLGNATFTVSEAAGEEQGLCWSAHCGSFHQEKVSEGATQGTAELSTMCRRALWFPLRPGGGCEGRSSAVRRRLCCKERGGFVEHGCSLSLFSLVCMWWCRTH